MQTLLRMFFLTIFSIFFLVEMDTYPYGVAKLFAKQLEIAKILLQEAEFTQTEEMALYYTEGLNEVYIRVPQVHKGDVVNIGNMLETSEKISTRLGFTAGQWLFLGKGSETSQSCKETPCTLARYNGYTERKQPFWHLMLKQGSAAVKNVTACDERGCISSETETTYYISANEAKTEAIAIQGTIIVRARNVSQAITVRQGEGTEILSPDAPPTRPIKIAPTRLRGIYDWIRTGVLVVREPNNGHVTDQPTVLLSGTISDSTLPSISVQNDHKHTVTIPLNQGEFQTALSLHEGQNHFTLSASTYYGKVEDTFSITRVSSPRELVQLPDVRGYTIPAAKSLLAQRGVSQVIVTRQITGRGVEDTVVEQAPVPETAVLPHTVVTLIVERGQLVRVPLLRTLSFTQAKETLQNNNLSVGRVVQQTTKRGPVGTIVAQSPISFAQVPPNSVIDLVEEAVEMVHVPDVEGKNLQDAAQLLAQIGLQVGDITGDASGTIIKQSPQPETKVPLQTKVNVEVKDIEREIARIRRGNHQPFPAQPPIALQTGDTRVKIENRTDRMLAFYFRGPKNYFIQLQPDQSMEVQLLPGNYQVAAEVKNAPVSPFYDQYTFLPNYKYDLGYFYIRRQWRW